MQFEWDETKSNACFTERGFDFAYVASAFADPNRMILRDERFEYGEERFQLIGRLQNGCTWWFTHCAETSSESSQPAKPT